MMSLLLPVLSTSAAYHLGALELEAGGAVCRFARKNLDFELGLLSVSHEPETWRYGWAANDGAIFDLHDAEGDLRFLDIDGLDEFEREALSAEVRARGLLTGADEWVATPAAYAILEVVDHSMVGSDARTSTQIAFEIAVAAALAGSPDLHGLWWTEAWAGMRSTRGGIFQSRLPLLVVTQISTSVSHLMTGPEHLEINF